MATRKDSNGRVLKKGEYQRKSGIYEFKYRDAQTHEVASISAQTLEQLREAEKDLMRGVYNGVKTTSRSLTVNDTYDRWVSLKRGLKDTTRSNYTYMYETYVQNDFGKKKIKDVKKPDVKAFFNRLYDSGLKTNTLETIQNVLHQVFDFAIDDGLILLNPCDKALKELKVEDRNKRLANPVHLDEVLDLDQQACFKDFMLTSEDMVHWYPIFVTFLETGMRVAEITGLIWDDCDLKNGIIHVRRNHTYNPDPNTRKSVHHVSTTKTVAGFRDIPMRSDVRKALEMLKKSGVRCVDTIDGVSGFVFANRDGHVYHQQPLNKALKRLSSLCNDESIKNGKSLLPAHLHCHMLRKTFCTNLARAGVDIKSAMDLMGHSDVETTLAIYTKVTKDMKQKAMISVDEYMRS